MKLANGSLATEEVNMQGITVLPQSPQDAETTFLGDEGLSPASLSKGISHTLSAIICSDCSFFKELQRTPGAAHHCHVCFGGYSPKSFIFFFLLAHESARHEAVFPEDHLPVPWWEAEMWLHFLRIKEPSFTFETRRGKNTIISLSVMFQSIHPLTITAKMPFGRNSLQR